MSSADLSPDPTLVLELLTAFRRSKIMFAATKLGVFDALEQQPRSTADLAGSLACNSDGLARLLDACVSLGLLQKDADQYRNLPAASIYLTSGSSRRLTGYVNYSNEMMWQLWAHLEDAVREGTHRWQQAFGWDGPIFSSLFKDERSKREFLIGMHGFGVISSPQVVIAHDLSRFNRLVDLGGATGHLAMAACEAYPHLQAVVADLPEVLPLAQEMIGQSQVANRIAVSACDFFRDPLPPADLYALGRIIHDWTEAKSLALLERIHQALPPGGGILIAEKLLNESKTGPEWALLQSLNMLTCTEGKERTLIEYRALLERVGFTDVQGRVTSAPLDAVLAVKPD
jgi:acetylserotonin N-methyltransferase